ncbi:hypothetical protein bcCo53_000267 [Borrelia coriaceae]|uniref:Cytosolic protein n=1 Tax=Borrelia coriaceae ATCC 43381 TaxID=1408429 RepID=W5SU47_9SPIR|nr:hypothetical protein [Borrelia coriaceae]AHH10435.1 Putative cytosolic protein [Borrelia coriaceae ATCC 43381]UPA16139.1 hypothetical protein bcCo53_000267 [Borrelia coriaceae]
MLFNKKSNYVLLFSSFAFIIAFILGIFARVPFITVLFRALFQFIFFFCIGLLLEFIYKKYLYDLFKDDSLNDNTSKGIDEDFKPESDNMNFYSENIDMNDNDNYSLAKELNKYDATIKENKFNGKLSEQISHVGNTDPKIVAEAIKTLINKKE